MNDNWFCHRQRRRRWIDEWRRDYNEVRPHSSLNDLKPMEYIKKQQDEAHNQWRRLNNNWSEEWGKVNPSLNDRQF